MQVRKVAIVATGALATAAAMGSTPAFAADTAGAAEVAPATVGVLEYQGAHRASDEAMRELAEQWLAATPEQTWSAPWEQEPPQILTIGTGSAASVGAWQQCASHGPFIGGLSVPVASPATVLGDCRNGNIDIAQGGSSDALVSILDNSALSLAAFQQCASGVGALGATVPIASPMTVTGSCDNGNITIGTPEEDNGYDYGYEAPVKQKPAHKKPPADYPYHKYEPVEADAADAVEADAADAVEADAVDAAEAVVAEPEQTVVPSSAPWEQEPPQILSAGSGSALSGAAWQQCASHGGFILGASVPLASPATVMDGCRNGNIDIYDEPGDALFSFLDGTAISALAFQQCASGAGGASATIPIASPMTVVGGCDNGNIRVG